MGLFFAGSVLFINGVSLLGRCPPAEAATINAFVGTLLVGVAASICIPVSHLHGSTAFSAIGFLLFAFTYLGVAINNWTRGSGAALGWYCLWAAAGSLLLASVGFTRYHDPRLGMLWLLWALLFALFFLVLACGLTQLEWATGWAATIDAVVTTTIPGALMLLGQWHSVPGSLVLAAGGTTALLIVALALWSRTRNTGGLVPAASSPAQSVRSRSSPKQAYSGISSQR